MINNNQDRQIFIVGMPRSGTTLLQLLLSSHSKIALTQETHFFRLFWERREKYGNLMKDNNFNKLYKDITDCRFIKKLEIQNLEKIIKTVNRNNFYKEFIQAILKKKAIDKDKKFSGEKTPGHLLYTEEIIKMFNNVKIINIIRNPIDVISSTIKTSWNKKSLLKNVKRWNKYIELAIKYNIEFKENFYIIIYERLVQNPDTELKNLFNFLKIEYEKEILEFYRDKEEILNITKEDNFNNPINMDSIGKGYKELSFLRRLIIEIYCGKYFKFFGYKNFKDKIGQLIKNIF